MDGFVQHCKRAMCRGDSDDGGDENRMINQEYEERSTFLHVDADGRKRQRTFNYLLGNYITISNAKNVFRCTKHTSILTIKSFCGIVGIFRKTARIQMERAVATASIYTMPCNGEYQEMAII